LLRNPAGYRGGFWTSFIMNGQTYVVSSVELTHRMSIVTSDNSTDRLQVELDYTPDEQNKPVLRYGIDVWSKNQPVLLCRHKTTNASEHRIEDMKVYSFMDFDLNGPASYKDDMGEFDPKTGNMLAWDDNALAVAMASKPFPDTWDISKPARLRVKEGRRDLTGNLQLGPKDIAVAFQWNYGNLRPTESKSVDVVIASAVSLEEVKALIPKGWELFGRKMR
jgi:hypothetical protein